MDLTALASLVLGALLALAGGIATELWKQRQAARAAARLVWLELALGHSYLLGAVALDHWPSKFTFSDEAWRAQRDRLALTRSAKEFQELQTAYVVLHQIANLSPSEVEDPVLYWPALMAVDSAVRILGDAAGVDREQLDRFRRPLPERLEEIRTAVHKMRTLPTEGEQNPFDDAVAAALEHFPSQLRARATQAFARHRPKIPSPDVTKEGAPTRTSEE